MGPPGCRACSWTWSGWWWWGTRLLSRWWWSLWGARTKTRQGKNNSRSRFISEFVTRSFFTLRVSISVLLMTYSAGCTGWHWGKLNEHLNLEYWLSWILLWESWRLRLLINIVTHLDLVFMFQNAKLILTRAFDAFPFVEFWKKGYFQVSKNRIKLV